MTARSPARSDIAERLRSAVQAVGLPGPAGQPISISIGAAACAPTYGGGAWTEDAPKRPIEALIAAADTMMFEAKRRGRNCVRGSTASMVIYSKPRP